MSTHAELNTALKAHGWRYVVDREQFMHGDQGLTWTDVISLVPGMTLDELTSYMDEQCDRLQEMRAGQH